MAMYQFMIATRIGDGTVTLTNADGEVTSHLSGLLSRTIRMLEVGIKPVWVFDGKAPDLKRGELDRRKEKRAEASAALDAAKEAGDEEEVRAQAKRLVSVTREMNEDAKKMRVKYRKLLSQVKKQIRFLRSSLRGKEAI